MYVPVSFLELPSNLLPWPQGDPNRHVCSIWSFSPSQATGTTERTRPIPEQWESRITDPRSPEQELSGGHQGVSVFSTMWTEAMVKSSYWKKKKNKASTHKEMEKQDGGKLLPEGPMAHSILPPGPACPGDFWIWSEHPFTKVHGKEERSGKEIPQDLKKGIILGETFLCILFNHISTFFNTERTATKRIIKYILLWVKVSVYHWHDEI